MTEPQERGMRRVRTGHVVSNAMDKTVVVRVRTTGQHALYSKAVRRVEKFYADDPENSCRVGDVVRIAETRPLSKLKRWRVVEVVERARE
ncbi:MAG TPA: 30S ribosomal protein S17 [Actinomycetota bacterium]|nr:30S ribosomal protein S17 [Actinomycetota bacterium]